MTLSFPLPALAQATAEAVTASPITAEEALERSADMYGPPVPVEDCPEVEAGMISNEIIICRKRQDTSKFRIRSEQDAEADYAAATMDAGDPRAPNLGPPPCVPSLLTLCVIPKKAKPSVPDIDFAAIPEAPPGSDADRIGRGLPPRGNDDGMPVESELVLPPLKTNEGADGEPGDSAQTSPPAKLRT